jgi:integration host factor subunit alpha
MTQSIDLTDEFCSAMTPSGRSTRSVVTRVELTEAVYQKVGLSRVESARLVELVLKEITDCLERGEPVKLSSFGSFVVRNFVVRNKGPRMGRNPRTGVGVPIPPHRVLAFKPSGTLRRRLNLGDETSD